MTKTNNRAAKPCLKEQPYCLSLNNCTIVKQVQEFHPSEGGVAEGNCIRLLSAITH